MGKSSKSKIAEIKFDGCEDQLNLVPHRNGLEMYGSLKRNFCAISDSLIIPRTEIDFTLWAHETG